MAGLWQPWLFVAACLLVQADATQQHSHGRMNPIRKVVNLLMAMQKKVEQEGQQTTELYDKFMCNTKTIIAGLEKSIEEAKEHIPQLESSVKEVTSQHQQLAEELVTAKEDRDKALKAVSQATSLRDKEAAEFAKESAGQRADIDAVVKAVKALEKGLTQGGNFLQSRVGDKASTILRRLAMSSNIDLSNVDRDMLSNFLQGGEQEPSSGEILGIMKQMHEEMTKDLAEMVSSEDQAVADHSSLVAAKKKEIKASTKAIEVKTGRKGELAVELTKLKNDLEDTKETLAEDSEFLGASTKSVEKKEHEFEKYKEIQSQELVALSDTIKMLNEDDALDLFKKTLPSPQAASFVQVPVTAKQMKSDALRVLRGARHRGHKKGHTDPRLDLLALWVQGRKGGSFQEVLVKIDKLVSNLKKEQADDEAKKSWCLVEVDKTEDEIKYSSRAVSDEEKVIANSKEDLKGIVAEITLLTKGIKELDESVKAATKQRKEENIMYSNTLSQNGAAKELLQMAKTRLNKFYNPKLVEAPQKPEKPEPALVQEAEPTHDSELLDKNSDSEDEEAPAFVQVRSHSQVEAEETTEEATDSENNDESLISSDSSDESEQQRQPRQEQKQESAGVIQMLSSLEADVGKQILELELEEKEAQKDYEVFMADSSTKRGLDSKAVADKESAKAKVETELQKAKVKMEGESTSLLESKKELYELHNDCDWLLKNFDARKSAREDEADALTKARAVLSGADYS